MNTKQQWLALALTPGLGPVTIGKLISLFGSASGIFAAEPKKLAECTFLRKESAASICDKEKNSQRLAEKELARAQKAGVQILCWDDPLYPKLLKEIPDPPPLLYVKGSIHALSCPGVAMVGARAATSYGLQVSKHLAQELARCNLSVISGFALGIDSAAHQGALSAGGATIAVLGCGLDIVYPATNKKLYAEIAANGAIVSEYPMGTPPDGFRFPARNRIISGLSLGVLVVEAARHSGTLITANLALDQGREVFVVPGRIDSPKSEGCHRLAQEGAKLIHSVADILAELPAGANPSPTSDTSSTSRLAPEEEKLFSFLDVYPKNIEQLIAETNMPPQKIQEALLNLELRGLVAALPGKQYQRLAEPSSSSV